MKKIKKEKIIEENKRNSSWNFLKEVKTLGLLFLTTKMLKVTFIFQKENGKSKKQSKSSCTNR